jgi:hypothetical protein
MSFIGVVEHRLAKFGQLGVPALASSIHGRVRDLYAAELVLPLPESDNAAPRCYFLLAS